MGDSQARDFVFFRMRHVEARKGFAVPISLVDNTCLDISANERPGPGRVSPKTVSLFGTLSVPERMCGIMIMMGLGARNSIRGTFATDFRAIRHFFSLARARSESVFVRRRENHRVFIG